jgi:hypothetical protein
MADFSELQGKTLSSISPAKKGDGEIVFITTEGDRYTLSHCQDCCESVEVEDVEGDLTDLIGSPITLAEESTSSDAIPGQDLKYADSFTWTFYRLATAKGFVVIRWLGESNGYYSESVDFYKHGNSRHE